MSIRRNYRIKTTDSDDDDIDSNKHTQSYTKEHTENRSILSFGDELDDDNMFQEKKASVIQKPIKSKESKRRPKKLVETKLSDIDIHTQETFHLKQFESSKFEETNDFSEQDKLESLIPKGDIPNAEAIDRLKKKREMAKQQMNKSKDLSPEEIKTMSLNFEIESDSPPRRHVNKNKQVMEMVGHQNNFEKERQALRESFLAVEHGADRDSDQENDWENRQMQNAINKVIHTTKDDDKIDWTQNSAKRELDSKSVILNELNTITPDDLDIINFSELLRRRKDEIIEQRRQSEDEIVIKNQTAIEKDTKAKEAEEEIPILEMKYNVFNNFKQYLFILIECFDNKMDKIVYLEKKFIKFYQDRADKISKRTRQDVQDQFDEIILGTKASAAVQSTFEMTNRAIRIGEKESRHLRRVKIRESQGIISHYNGLSSDDEEPKSILSNRQNEFDQINTEKDQLFQDTESEYSSIVHILDRFVEIQKKFEVDYSEAFINGFIPHVISPLVRLELITWNPLITPRFDKWNWFKVLVEFTKSSITHDDRDFDPSAVYFNYLKVIPTIFEKTIIPKLIDWTTIWNPMSATETQNYAKFIGKLISQMPTINNKSVHVRNLMKTIASRVNDCIGDDISIPLYLEKYKESPNGPAFQFFNRQMWSVIKTFCNIMMLHEILDTKLLCKLTMDGILNNYIITGLMILMTMEQPSIIIAMVKTIKHSFPRKWFINQSDGQTSDTVDLSNELSALIRFINNFGATYKNEKMYLDFAFSMLDYFNVSRSELNKSLKD